MPMFMEATAVMKRAKDRGLARAIEVAGTAANLARMLDISAQSICKWTKVPLERVHEVARVTGIPKEELRPDFFEKP